MTFILKFQDLLICALLGCHENNIGNDSFLCHETPTESLCKHTRARITQHCLIITDTYYIAPLAPQWDIHHHSELPKYKMTTIKQIKLCVSGKNESPPMHCHKNRTLSALIQQTNPLVDLCIVLSPLTQNQTESTVNGSTDVWVDHSQQLPHPIDEIFPCKYGSVSISKHQFEIGDYIFNRQKQLQSKILSYIAVLLRKFKREGPPR